MRWGSVLFEVAVKVFGKISTAASKKVLIRKLMLASYY